MFKDREYYSQEKMNDCMIKLRIKNIKRKITKKKEEWEKYEECEEMKYMKK
jgi:hypothetical protein